MGKRLLKHKIDTEENPLSQKNGEIAIQEFLNLYEKFVEQKSLEGLRERTLKDYTEHLKYIKKWLKEDNGVYQSDAFFLDVNFVRSYIYYMQEEKHLGNSTINIRLRTLKTYLKWLFDEGYIKNIYTY